jgi:[CysO sulfur-carrier protein]-S-L-cysteine hydrolase
MARTLTIPRPVLAAVLAHARAELPNECCGLLAGSGGRVTDYHPLVNELRSPRAYRSEPRSLLDAMKAMRAAGTDLVAVCHSHPTSAPVPSKIDVAENTYGDVPHLIVGFPGAVSAVRVLQITSGGCEEIAWAISGDAGVM